MKSFKGVMSWV